MSPERLADIRELLRPLGRGPLADLVNAVMAQELLAEVDRLTAENADLTAQLEVARGERFGTDPAALGQAFAAAEHTLRPTTEEEEEEETDAL